MKKQLTVNGESIQSLSETLLNFLNEINLNYNKNIAIAVNEEIVEKYPYEGPIFIEVEDHPI